MPVPNREYNKMEFETGYDCKVEFEALEEKSAYEILCDTHVTELAERFKPVEAASNDL
jgi:hypothetical protein